MTRPTISWPGTITPVPRPLDETGCRDRRRKAGGCYEELAKRFEADGWIVGRVTMEQVVDGVARTPKAVAGDLRWATTRLLFSVNRSLTNICPN
jgi:hypothetical protein